MKLHDPQDLYELWERQHWLSQDIDLTTDVEQWAAITPDTKEALMRALASFFIGEERVASQFCGLIRSAANPQELSYLTTQQVDESRHMQFFDRFYREVVKLDVSAMSERVDHARDRLGDDFAAIVETRLTAVDRRLLDAPDDIEAKVDYVTIYHMVIEGMLGIAGQRAVREFLERHGAILPGLRLGFELIERDEHRHVAYGTWFLAQAAARDPRLGDRVRERLAEVIPTALGSIRRDSPKHAEQVCDFALLALRRRLSVVGISLDRELVTR
ncbi:MAG: ribonucleoside-diphosphate reductase beta chain [bacterium]